MDEEKKKMVVDMFKAASKPKKRNSKPPSQKTSIRIEHCQGHIVGQQFTVHHYDPEHCRGCRSGQAERDQRHDTRLLILALAMAVAVAILLPQILGSGLR